MNDSQSINGQIETRGLLLSKSYPQWEPNQNVVKTLYTTSMSSAFKIYITDISMDDPNIFFGQ